jgi:uncharacterized protein (TIGR00288 family)
MDSSKTANRVAVFIDAENMVIEAEKAGIPFDLDLLLLRVREEGQIVIATAYGDWTQPPLFNYRRVFRQKVVELLEVATDQRGKNTADIKLAVDALEMVFLPHPPDVFVVLTGDRDLVPLVQKIKRYGKSVLGIGVKGSTSQDLVQACNTFLYLDDLYDEQTAPTPAPEPAAAPKRAVRKVALPAPVVALSPELQQERIRAFHLLARAIATLGRQGRAALGSATLPLMQQLDSTFTPTRLGFASFKDFALAAAHDDYVAVRVDDRGGDFQIELHPSSPAVLSSFAQPEAEEELPWRLDTPEDARDTYKLILLKKKNVPILPWADREALVYRLWEMLREEGPRSVLQMNDGLKRYARQQQLGAPDRAIEKLTHTLNIARCFAHEGRVEYWTDMTLPLTTAVEEPAAIERMHETYIRALRLAVGDIPLEERGLALLLFDEVTDATLARVRPTIAELDGRSGEGSESPMAAALRRAGVSAP